MDPRSLRATARALAEQGYLVTIAPMPFNLAVFKPAAADAVIAAHPEVTNWAIGGHSLGGAMAANYVYTHPDAVEGLALWAAYPAGNNGLADSAALDVVLDFWHARRPGDAREDCRPRVHCCRRLPVGCPSKGAITPSSAGMARRMTTTKPPSVVRTNSSRWSPRRRNCFRRWASSLQGQVQIGVVAECGSAAESDRSATAATVQPDPGAMDRCSGLRFILIAAESVNRCA